MNKDILSYWPNPKWKPREGQKYVLEQAEASDWDVLVVTVPTGGGKTILGNTLLKWLKGQGAYLTPTNMLVGQFRDEYPQWASLQRKASYTCAPNKGKCSTTYAKKKAHCKGCPYVKDLRKIRAVPHKVLTYYMYMAQKLKCPNIVFDEAHNLIPTIRDLEARKIWRHEFSYPSGLRTVGQLREWLRSCPGYDRGFPNDPKLALLAAELDANEERFLIHKSTDFYRGDERDLLKLLPLDISKAKPHLWPKAKKLVLMSATIGRKDIESLGLDRRKVLYLEAPSPIPPARRPVYVHPLGSFSYKADGQNLPALASFIKEKMTKYPNEKGLVHLTYSMAQEMRKHISDPRILWHDGNTKSAVYRRWIAMPKESGAVLMACGMYEGLDLLNDLGRFQILAKVPWPSLADPAIAHKAKADDEWYQWEALKFVVQAAGRICRSPTDWGETTIVDSSFMRMDQNLFPNFFKEALVWPK